MFESLIFEEDKIKIQNLLFKKNKNLLEAIKKSNATIAGGFMTSYFTKAPFNDIDLFFENKTELEWAIKYFDTQFSLAYKPEDSPLYNSRGYRVVWGSTKNIMVQIITNPKLLAEPQGVIEKFDFTICKAAYNIAKDEFITHPFFLKDVSARKLSFDAEPNKIFSTFFRVLKYQKKGFVLAEKELFKMLLLMFEMKFETNSEVAEATAGFYTEGGKDKFLEELHKDKSPFSVEKILKSLNEWEKRLLVKPVATPIAGPSGTSVELSPSSPKGTFDFDLNLEKLAKSLGVSSIEMEKENNDDLPF